MINSEKLTERLMTQRERIAWYVLRGELLESKSLNIAYKDLGGANSIKGKAARAEWLMENASPGELDMYINFEYIRICSHCGKPMGWGYCIDGGGEYYCSEECLHQHFSEEEYQQLYNDGNSDTYFTCWID